MLLLRKHRIQPHTRIQHTGSEVEKPSWKWSNPGETGATASAVFAVFWPSTISTVTDSNTVVTPAVSGLEAGLPKQR